MVEVLNLLLNLIDFGLVDFVGNTDIMGVVRVVRSRHSRKVRRLLRCLQAAGSPLVRL